MDNPNKNPIKKSVALLSGKYLFKIIPMASDIIPTGNDTD